MIVSVTVNRTDNTEYTHEMSATDFSDVRDILNLALGVEQVTPSQWSSLLVTIVNEALDDR